MGDKKCPQCAETVKGDARVCRFCGWNFARSAPAPRPASKNSFQSCMTVIGAIIVIIIILGMIGSCSDGRTDELEGGSRSVNVSWSSSGVKN